jgi:hypothetical protein
MVYRLLVGIQAASAISRLEQVVRCLLVLPGLLVVMGQGLRIVGTPGL